MQTVPFAGLHFSGHVELSASGISVSAAPSDPSAEAGRVSVVFDPTPNEADDIAACIWGWAEVCREVGYMDDQMTLPGMPT